MEPFVQETGISPGIARGKVRVVTDRKSAATAAEEDIVVSAHFLPPLPNLARKAAGFVFTGNEADHGVSYVKEIWKPAVIVPGVSTLKEGDVVTIDGKTGAIYRGIVDLAEYSHHERLKYDLQTKIYLHASIPWVARKASALNTAGVGLLRTNLLIEETAKHPYYHYVKKGKQEELIALIAEGIATIAKAFAPKPVWVRTMDFATDELALFEDGEQETHEENPLLGWRGLARSLAQPELFKADVLALKRVVEAGHTNVGVIFPLVRDVSEYREAKKRMQKLGLAPHTHIKVGSMFETPSSALQIDEFIAEGIDLAFVGVNDITMYTLAADRTNPNMQTSYNPANSAILNLVHALLQKCRANSIETTTSYLTPLKPHLSALLQSGLTSITLQADRINEVAEIVSQAESREL